MRILLIKTSSMGDVIHNLPVVSDICAHHPNAEIDWVVEENFAEIPRLHPGVSKVIPVAVRRWRKHLLSATTWQEINEFDNEIRRAHYDFIIDTQGLLKSALLAWRCRGLRCGYDAKSAREPIAAHAYDRRFRVDTKLHAVTRNRNLAGLAMGYTADAVLDYGLTAMASAHTTKATAVLLTATSRDDKLWPEDRWILLGQALSENGITCVLPGGNTLERERAARLAAAIPQAIALPPLGLSALAQEIAAAQVVIGVDTGLVHLAAALGRPTIALYCASDPLLTGVIAATPFQNLGARGAPPPFEAVLQRVTSMIPMLICQP